MDIRPDYRRLLATISREEPDRVPLAELVIDRTVAERFMGRNLDSVADQVEFWHQAGYDYIYMRPAYEYPGVPPSAAAGTPAQWEASKMGGAKAESISIMVPGSITKLADLELYPWPDPQAVDCSTIEQAACLLPEGMGIISGVGGIFTRTWMILGYENFCLSLSENPEVVATVFERVGRIQCEVLRRVVELPRVFAIWYGDDLAYTEGLMVSPRVLRQHVFPWVEELASIAHRAGMPFIMHSDGLLWEVIPDLIRLGLNALHPIEPKAMDINEVKARYGDRLALFGNIDLSYTLTRGTPAEVRAEVRQRIKDLAPGGGYAVGSSNSVTHYVPVENYNAMREAVFEFGRYPIDL